MSHATGFWGKLPSRGDFLGAGLSKQMIAQWDVWVSAGIDASRQSMGEAWQDAWMEAPVWCFRAAAGLLSTAETSGLWMPSVDRAGRPFPLLIAMEGPAAEDWFFRAEEAGRAALQQALGPDALSGRLPSALPGAAIGTGSIWWTEGSPLVAPCRRAFPALPGPERFALMLDDAA
jgi:type VI secretion system protein ImpM